MVEEPSESRGNVPPDPVPPPAPDIPRPPWTESAAARPEAATGAASIPTAPGVPPPPASGARGWGANRWSAAASWAVGFLAAYAFLVLIQVALAFLAHRTQVGDVGWAVSRILGTVGLAWALLRRQRWAWWLATVLCGVFGLLGVLAAIVLVASVLFGSAEPESLLPFGLVSAALVAGTMLSLVGALCALVVGLTQQVPRPAEAGSGRPATVGPTRAHPTGPSPVVGPVLLLVTVLALALGLSAVRDATGGPSGVRNRAELGSTGREPQPGDESPDPGGAPPQTSSPEDPGGVQLPDGFNAIAVDDARRQVFVSSASANVVSVLDFGGRLVHTIGGIAGPGALLVDGDRLFVASTTGGRIDVLDAARFAPLARYGEGTVVKPGPLVKAGGRLWTSTGSCGNFETTLVSIDPASGATVVHPPIESLRYCIELASSPTDPNVLLGFNPGLSPATVVRLDVSGATPRLVSDRRQEELGNLRQLAVLPRGDRFVAASGSPYTFLEFKTEDLVESGIEYPAEAYPTAAATTPARGGLLAAGISTSDDPDIYVYRAGDPAQRLSTLDVKGSSELLSRGLAWAPDGSALFAVSGTTGGDQTRFHVFAM